MNKIFRYKKNNMNLIKNLIKSTIKEIKIDIDKEHLNLTKDIKFYTFNYRSSCHADTIRKTISISAFQIVQLYTCSFGNEERVEIAKNSCDNIKEFIRFVVAHEIGHIFDRVTNIHAYLAKGKEQGQIFADEFAYKFYKKEK